MQTGRSILRIFVTALALGAPALLATPAGAEISVQDRSEIETIIKNYLVEHPETLRDAMNALDRKEKEQQAAAATKALSDQSGAIFNSSHEAVLGNPKGKVTLVEFFDYNCPHCRNIVDDLDKLMKANPDLRFVLKDFPILTPQSRDAAKVAIALRAQVHGQPYWDFHKKLMEAKGLVGEPEALSAAKSVGADMTRLRKDESGPEVAASLQEVGQLADAIQASGTPTFILGDSVMAGEMTADQLQPMIDAVRKCGKTACA